MGERGSRRNAWRRKTKILVLRVSYRFATWHWSVYSQFSTPVVVTVVFDSKKVCHNTWSDLRNRCSTNSCVAAAAADWRSSSTYWCEQQLQRCRVEQRRSDCAVPGPRARKFRVIRLGRACRVRSERRFSVDTLHNENPLEHCAEHFDIVSSRRRKSTQDERAF